MKVTSGLVLRPCQTFCNIYDTSQCMYFAHKFIYMYCSMDGLEESCEAQGRTPTTCSELLAQQHPGRRTTWSNLTIPCASQGLPPLQRNGCQQVLCS